MLVLDSLALSHPAFLSLLFLDGAMMLRMNMVGVNMLSAILLPVVRGPSDKKVGDMMRISCGYDVEDEHGGKNMLSAIILLPAGGNQI
jgi:hypothetical protein